MFWMQISLNAELANAFYNAVVFIQKSSFLVSYFSDSRCIKRHGDRRLESLGDTSSWFQSMWKLFTLLSSLH